MKFIIDTPEEFSFQLSLDFLRRSPRELLHRITDQKVRKLIKVGSQDVLFELSQHPDGLQVHILNIEIQPQDITYISRYVREWLDLDTDLKPFYALASKDKLLHELVIRFYGYRIVGQPDLFESLIWAVLGQQINVQFAFTLKQRFVEQFGSKLIFEGEDYYLFPKPETIALLSDDHLLPLQFSRQKSKYTVLIAEAFASMTITKDKLKDLPFAQARDLLVKIKGVGNWTANYALMKTFHYPDAFPLEDVGVHNAIRILKKMKRKPTLEEVKRIFKRYKGWEAYATLYLWKSL